MSCSRETIAKVCEVKTDEVRCDNCNRWWNGICHWWNLNATEPTDFCSLWVKKESDTE